MGSIAPPPGHSQAIPLHRRCQILGRLGGGGMAAVYLARLHGPMGFSRSVAVKSLHPAFCQDPHFVSMLLDEARLASRVSHPNVVGVVDLSADRGELQLVLDYVHGASLREILDGCTAPVPVPVAVSVVHDVLEGLHAAHEARGPGGSLLGLVHRDVSPHNALVGVDGIARISDFGIAKAAWRTQSTRDGQLKGKLAYMAPEQLEEGPVDRRADLFAVSIVLWELLAGKRLFDLENPAQHLARLHGFVPPDPSCLRADVPPALAEVIVRGLSARPDGRFSTAQEMLECLVAACALPHRRVVAAWVLDNAEALVQERSALLDARDSEPGTTTPSPSNAPAGYRTSPEDSTAVIESSSVPQPVIGLPLRASAGLRSFALLAAAAVTVGVAALLLRSPELPAASAPGPSATPPANASALVATSPLSATPPNADSPRAEPSASIAPEPTARPTLPARQASRPAPSSRKVPSSPNPGCAPPYFFDGAGVKIYKPECI